jgi:hypothetical protein|tara:strand:+ start:50 stop:241 length:192 start_codon:yes stop_codon:yes gene_type:complete
MIDLALASVVITAITLNIYIVDLIKKKRREIKQHDESIRLTSYDADPLDIVSSQEDIGGSLWQ